MEINEKDVREAYETACDNTKQVMRKLFPFLRGKITERVKTFDDAMNELGDNHPFVKEYNAVAACSGMSPDLVAYLKLRIIAEALNEGWEPQFSDGEQRWYPWLILWTKEELQGKSEEWKREREIRSCANHKVLFGGVAIYGAYAGFACADADNAPSFAAASIGSRLCFKSEALAVYAGKQFIDLWMDYCMVRK